MVDLLGDLARQATVTLFNLILVEHQTIVLLNLILNFSLYVTVFYCFLLPPLMHIHRN